MADDPPQDAPAPPGACTACRGTGAVSSNLGGTSHEVPCPWCEGTGTRLPEHDAQTQAPPVEPPPAAA